MPGDVTPVDRPTGRERSALDRFVPTHLKATRRSWVFLLVAVTVVFSLVEASRTLVRMHGEVVPGVYYNLKLGVSVPLPEAAAAAGIRVGDRIERVDARAFDDAFALSDYLRGIGVDRPLRLEMTRGSRRTVADLSTFSPSWGIAWFQLVTGATFALLGLGVFWFHPGRRESWPFLFACAAWGVAILGGIGHPRTTQSSLDIRLGLLAYAVAGPMLLHLFSVFPRPLRIAIHRPYLFTLMDALALALGCVLAALQPTTKPLAVALGMVALIDAVALIAIVAIVVWRLRRPAPAEDTTRLRALIVAVVVAFPLPAIFTFVRVFGFIPETHAMRVIAMSTTVLFPVLVGYAIARRDLLEIDRAVVRAAAVSAIVGAAALVAAVLAVALPALFAPASVVASPQAMGMLVLAGIAILWPIKRRLERRLIDRIVRPDLDEQLEVVRAAFAALADTMEPALYGRLERRLEEILEVDDVAVLVPEGTSLLRPATGERVDRAVFGRLVELRLLDDVVGTLGLGRPGPSMELSSKAAQLIDVLGPEIARALRSGRSGDRIGDYRIERFLAAGGMGNVYVGTRTGAGGFVKQVAIKQLLPELAVQPAVVDRFLKEARLVARLRHPGIVQTFELGQNEGGYFIVMEYVDGVDAATLLRRCKRRRERIALPVAVHAATQICLALDHVHRACDEAGAPLKLIHHDISPHNVIIDSDGNVKLADFGVAHIRHDASPAGQLVGKAGYISPEQIAGHPYDHRVDVFASGIVLYELVTLQHPFARGTEEATLRATQHGRYLPPETLRDDCSDELVEVIARALAPVERRFASAAELADALQRVHPLDSRHAAELGRLVRSVKTIDPSSSASMPATVSLPTVRG